MKEENIYNLTELWKAAGLISGTQIESSNYITSIVVNSEWPNRIWLKNNFDDDTFTSIKNFMLNSKVNLTLPIWHLNNKTESFMNSFGLQLKFKQVGMSLILNEKFEIEKRLNIKKITTLEEAEIWEPIYPEAFGYKISKEIILNSNNKINFYLAKLDDSPIGTAITFNTDDIIGIHGVGITPGARRKGYAEEIMKHVLNDAFESGFKTSTLQASDMGKNIYLRMGYQEDFIIENYIL